MFEILSKAFAHIELLNLKINQKFPRITAACDGFEEISIHFLKASKTLEFP